jgi:hypothetical protein
MCQRLPCSRYPIVEISPRSLGVKLDVGGVHVWVFNVHLYEGHMGMADLQSGNTRWPSAQPYAEQDSEICEKVSLFLHYHSDVHPSLKPIIHPSEIREKFLYFYTTIRDFCFPRSGSGTRWPSAQPYAEQDSEICKKFLYFYTTIPTSILP